MALVQGTSNALNSGLRGSYQASWETHLLKYGSANIPKAVNTDLASQRNRIRTAVPIFVSALVRDRCAEHQVAAPHQPLVCWCSCRAASDKL